MKLYRLGLTLALLCLPTTAFAQWGYVGYAATTVDNTSGGVPFPSAQISDSGHLRPTQVFCSVEGADIRWTVDGTAPTASVGHLALDDSPLPSISGTTLLSNFRAIRTAGTNATLHCSYFAGGSLPFREWTPPTVVGGGSGGAVTQSGTWTVQPGNTANSTAWLVTGTGGTFPVTGTFWQATQPVSAASLPLPSGASTSAKQDTIIGHIDTLEALLAALETLTVDRGSGWSTDPCAGTPSSVVIDTATAANNELVAISGSTVVYVCGWSVESVGTVNWQFISGTGTACATGETNKTGLFETVAQWGTNVGFSGSTVFKGSAGEAVCIELSTTVGVKGILSYVQQ